MSLVTLLPVKTLIYVAVQAADVAEATRRGVDVYRILINRLYQENPMIQGIRIDMDEPTPRKDATGVFDCAGHMQVEIPDTLRTLAQSDPLDAWRDIVRVTVRDATRGLEPTVWRTSTFVAMSRIARPEAGAPAAAAKVEAPKKTITITVTVGGKESDIAVPEGENLLDGCLDKNIDVKWDCKNGVCDSCRIKVHAGMENLSEVTAGEENMLGDQLKQGYRLSCQVTVKGPVKIAQ